MNRVEFTLTVDDLVAAQRLYQLGGAKWLLGVFGAAVVALIFLNVIWPDDASGSDAGAILFAVLAIIILVPIISRFWRIPRMARRAFAQDSLLSKSCVFSWNSHEASAESEDASWKQALGDFAGWRADDAVILLFRQTHLYHLIPTRAFTDTATRQSLIDALVANGVSDKWPPK